MREPPHSPPKTTPLTLKNRADFLRLNRARKSVTPYFIIRSAANGLGHHRVGYTVTTKCGNAVLRNRIKRRLRALVRELLPQQPAVPARDFVFIALAQASPNAADVNAALLREAVQRALAHSAQTA